LQQASTSSNMFSKALTVTTLILSASLHAVAAPAYTIPTISSDATCQKMFAQCGQVISADGTDAWQHLPCIFAATCFGGQRPVAGLLYTAWEDKNQGQGTTSQAPAPANIPRVSQDLFNQIAPSGQLSQQNFIDGWYSYLDTVGGPYPPNANQVSDQFFILLLSLF
jgi:hypothetical protein